MIRDGRDVALSTLDKWGDSEPHVDVYYAARIWRRRIRQARSAGHRLGPRLYREVRYEALVRDAESELRAVCKFLGETYMPLMTRQHREAQDHVSPQGFHAAVLQPPNTTRVDRWRREMSVKDQRLFQRVAGDLLDELAYPLIALSPMSSREQVRLLALRAKYETLQAGRRLAQAVSLVPPIYGRPVSRSAREEGG
jgi:hypothetical protein